MTLYEQAPPPTYHVDVGQARETLDYVEMIALARMFERWALTEENIDSAQRTKLIQWSSDYEAIAEHCGRNWIASRPESAQSLIVFVAQCEARATGLYRWTTAS